jgi:hypothetical protein
MLIRLVCSLEVLCIQNSNPRRLFVASRCTAHMALSHLCCLLFSLLLSFISTSVSSSPPHDHLPTHTPTSSEQFKDSVFFEALSVVSLIVMVIVLIIGFFGDCFGVLCPRKEFGALDSWNFGHESREGLNKYSLELTTKFSIKETPIELIKKVQQGLEIYSRVYGNDLIPSEWKIPTTQPWPAELWGFNLGHHLNSLCGTSAVFPSKPISQGVAAQDGKGKGKGRRHDEDEEDSPQHETWYELFYDLVFVASAIQLGTVIKYDHRFLGMVKASVLFLMLRSTWDHLTLYQNRSQTCFLSSLPHYLSLSLGLVSDSMSMMCHTRPIISCRRWESL